MSRSPQGIYCRSPKGTEDMSPQGIYRKSLKGRATKAKYNQSIRVKEARTEYDKSERGHDRYLQRIFGITLENYNIILNSQDRKCAICGLSGGTGGKISPRLSVDHDHITGRVRGLLCGLCNTAIGFFKDSPYLLRNAADYIERKG